MTKFEELEKIIQESQASYSLSGDREDEKKYTIFSESLKSSLRNSINSASRQEG